MQSEYYDPDTGIIHINNFVDGTSISAGASEGTELGLNNTTFDDVKIKILSIKYDFMIYSTNASGGGDFNQDAFNSAREAFGEVIFGVSNYGASPQNFYELATFTGTSAWPVDVRPWMSTCGRVTTVSKTWKPRKLAFSEEQVAFICVKNDASSNAAPTWYGGMYIRAVRL